MAQLFGRVPAVAALRQMLLDVGQQCAAPADRDIEETVVEPAILGRREFTMGMYTTLAECVTRLFECGRRDVGIHAQEAGRDA
jgi:hypothetical protein